jgi:hypothetical protein
MFGSAPKAHEVFSRNDAGHKTAPTKSSPTYKIGGVGDKVDSRGDLDLDGVPVQSTPQLKESLVGTWTSVSFAVVNDKGQAEDGCRPNPMGSLTYTADGRVSNFPTWGPAIPSLEARFCFGTGGPGQSKGNRKSSQGWAQNRAAKPTMLLSEVSTGRKPCSLNPEVFTLTETKGPSPPLSLDLPSLVSLARRAILSESLSILSVSPALAYESDTRCVPEVARNHKLWP